MKINFGKIDSIALLGGSFLTAALCRKLIQRQVSVMLYTSGRHLGDPVEKDGVTLRGVIEQIGIPYCVSEDINRERALFKWVKPSTLGLALGAAWIFEKPVVDLFQGRLLDFMGINLPRYRGGAHYSWQILARNREGCCNLQIIEGGSERLHRGNIIKRAEYFFPASVRIPQDYFDAAVPHELAFLEEFFDEIQQEKDFERQPLQETFSEYFPFLYTLKHGYVDWSWKTEEIERFICAFDRPYQGASTFLRGLRVFMRDCHAEYADGTFHPFHSGLIYRQTDHALFITTRDGTIVVRSLTDETGQSLMKGTLVGQRLCTPRSILDEAMQFTAVYDASGIKS